MNSRNVCLICKISLSEEEVRVIQPTLILRVMLVNQFKVWRVTTGSPT